MKIVFVSNSTLTPASRSSLQSAVPDIRIEERHNKGFDFGGWKYALDRDMVPDDTEYLLLTNDSILGPLFELSELFFKMENSLGVDFWGLTDSYQHSWHLQSYFVCLSSKVFHSDTFKFFFKQDFDRFHKNELIQKGEISFSTVLLNAGYRGMATSPYTMFDPDVALYPSLSRNPTHFYWDRLITESHFPFVKKEVILKNPENLQSLEDLFSVVRSVAPNFIDDIKEFFISTFNKPVPLRTDVSISVICHMYYPQTIYYYLLRLSELKSYQAKFFFNLSTALRYDNDFIEILTESFPQAIILFSPSQGRDIGGKLIALNTQLQLNIQSDYSLIIHDKLSPHFPLGAEWRNKLFEIIDSKNINKIFSHFANDPKVGLIGPMDYIKNEYNSDKNNFRCTSSSNIVKLMSDYNLTLTNYNFVAGTVFWIRTTILKSFFERVHPLSVRTSFEKGNALDFVNGTNIHAWERIFPFLANGQGYKIKGI